MNRDKLIINYEDKVKHDIMIVKMLKRINMGTLIKFRVSYFMGGRDIGLDNDKWHTVPGDALAIPIKFNMESILLDLLTCERSYPLVRWYIKDNKQINYLKIALSFKFILGWEQVLDQKNELPLHIGARVKTKLFEQYLKGTL